MSRFLVISIVAVVAIVVYELLMSMGQDEVVKSWPQPQEIAYDAKGPYALYVLRGPFIWKKLNGPTRTYLLWIDQANSPPSHGHEKQYQFAEYVDVESHIDRCTVEWNPEGVTFLEPTGHRVFVPKNAFIGGR